MVMRISAAAAASLGEAARRAPAASRESARDAVRFHTTSGNPALRRLWPMGRPIRPSPIKLTRGCGTIASVELRQSKRKKDQFIADTESVHGGGKALREIPRCACLCRQARKDGDKRLGLSG